MKTRLKENLSMREVLRLKESLEDTDLKNLVGLWFWGGRYYDHITMNPIYKKIATKKITFAQIEKKLKEIFEQQQKASPDFDWYGFQMPYEKHEKAFKNFFRNAEISGKHLLDLEKLGFKIRKPKLYSTEKHALNYAKKADKIVFKRNKNNIHDETYWVIFKNDEQLLSNHSDFERIL
jgi:hypothetical protein